MIYLDFKSILQADKNIKKLGYKSSLASFALDLKIA